MGGRNAATQPSMGSDRMVVSTANACAIEDLICRVDLSAAQVQIDEDEGREGGGPGCGWTEDAAYLPCYQRQSVSVQKVCP